MNVIIGIIVNIVVIVLIYRKGFRDGANRIIKEVETMNNRKKLIR